MVVTCSVRVGYGADNAIYRRFAAGGSVLLKKRSKVGIVLPDQDRGSDSYVGLRSGRGGLKRVSNVRFCNNRSKLDAGAATDYLSLTAGYLLLESTYATAK